MTALRIVHSEAATGFGGQEHRIFKEMLAMRERGHHLEAICQPHAALAERLRAEGFIVHTMYMDGARNYFPGIFRLRRLLRAGRYDVLNTHSRRDTMLVGLAARLAGTPLVVRTRHLARKPNSLVSYTGIPHRVTTVSEYVRRGLLERGVPAAHVATLYTPVALPPVIDRSSLRQEIGVSDDSLVVGCVAVMRRPKGHRDLVDALAPIMQERSDVHAVFVGGGSPVFEEVADYVAEKHLSDRIHMLGTRTDIANLLAGFDIFALATHHEALGTSFIEAAAAGLPLVGTDAGGVAEIIDDGVSGFLVPVRDPSALSAALRKLLESSVLRHEMGQAGMQACRFSGRFSPETLAIATEACYEGWLKELRR